MSFSSSDSTSNGSNVTRFTLDGIVAEMVVEVDNDQEPLLSPSKALKLNGLDSFEKLKTSTLRSSLVAVDSILKMDDNKLSSIESDEQKDSNSMQGEYDILSKEFQENQVFFKSVDIDEPEASMSKKSDSSKVKERDVLDVDKVRQTTETIEILQKDFFKIDDNESSIDDMSETNESELPQLVEDESPIDDLTESNRGELPEQDEDDSANDEVTESSESELPNQVEDESATNEAIKTVDSELAELNEDGTAIDQVTETNEDELPEQDDDELAIDEVTETNEDELPEQDENELAIDKVTERNEDELSEPDEEELAIDEVTERNEDELPELDEDKVTKTNEGNVPKQDEDGSSIDKAIKTNEGDMLEQDVDGLIDEMTKSNEGELPEQDESEYPMKAAKTDETELTEDENKSTFDEAIKTLSESAEKDTNESTFEDKTKTVPKFLENDETESTELTETNDAQQSEKVENKSAIKELPETNEIPSSDKDEIESVMQDGTKTNAQSPEKNDKPSWHKLTETVVVRCEPIDLKMLDFKMPSGPRKPSKLPLKKRKLAELEKTEEDVEDEGRPGSRTLRTRTSEKEKKEETSKSAKKKKDISNKSTPVPVKKAKVVKEEIPKRGSKRSLPEVDTAEKTGKRLRSTAQNSQMQRQSQGNSSSKKPETKDRKPKLRSRKPEIKNTKPEIKKKPEIKSKAPELRSRKPEIKNTKPEITKKPQEIKSKKPEIKSKTPETKIQSLRKSTLRKSANAPLSIESAKPKAYNLHRGKVTKLGVFTEIRENVHTSDMKYLRYLYRILYDQWPPKDINELKEEILNFEGYNFKKKSQELQNREQVLKKMPDASVSKICEILDLNVDNKENMISDIIKFLLKPVKIVLSTVDPFDQSMQPVVKLERFSLDYLKKSVKTEDKTPVPVKRSKRERYPSTKLEIYVSDISEKPSVSSTKDGEKKSQPEIKIENISDGESSKSVTVKQSAINKTKAVGKSPIKVKGSLASKYAKKRRKGLKHTKKGTRKNLMKLAKKIQTTESPVKQNSEVENYDSSFMPEPEIKQEPVIEDVREVGESNEIEETGAAKLSETPMRRPVREATKSRDSSSDATLSSDEAKQITKADSPKKRISHKRVGKPLRYFTKIKENILNANFSALQRLHILLFGASDKADNLKGNILAFGGFPFLEGSEEWKQKEFLLSLLAQNTLREYLKLLCVEYADDDQKTLIRKLMRFLAAPNDRTIDDELKTQTQVISSEPDSRAPVHAPKVPIKKKKVKKAEEKKSRTRKVLMDEAQVKRLEADLAREQRILERERKLHGDKSKKLQAKTTTTTMKKIQSFSIKDGMESDESLEKKAALTAKQTDAELLNALLQTVYKRRALKKAGVVISAPKKETLTRLGELANVKFLVVTANYSDLDVLHHLIYMTEANKGKVRKNILDFAGFNFTEDAQPYKDRITFLNSLGYDISKRIAFLLGLCPFKTEIEQQDLNELIMYFLMHPCKSKQIPIRHLPQTFFRNDIPKEICQLMQKHMDVEVPGAPAGPSTRPVKTSFEKQPEISIIEDEPSTSLPVRQKAKKSFKSSCLPSVQRKGLSPSISTLPLSAPKPLIRPTVTTTQSVLIPGPTNKMILSPFGISPMPSLQKPILRPSPPPAISIPSTPNSPHEVLIQQQTPDGQQKTFKLIKLPATQAMQSGVQSVLKNTPQQTALTIPAPIQPVVQSKPITFAQPVQVSPVIGGSLPSGLIFFKSNPPVAINQQPLPNIMQTVPVVLNPPAVNIAPVVSSANINQEKIVVPEVEKMDISVECESSEESVNDPNPLVDSNPPTDEELFNTIQEILHSSDFENMTLKNVLDRVAAQYSAFDLSHRHVYIKECIKKIIMGTT